MYQRGVERSPIETSDSANAAAYIDFSGAFLPSELTNATIAAVVPKDLNAPPPLGLPRWPKKGEVFLSPALADRDDVEHISTRYGHYAGILDPSGLISPTELFAYVYPSSRNIDLGSFTPISGFVYQDRTSDHDALLVGDLLDLPSVSQPLVGFGIGVGIPLLAFIVVGLRFDLSQRREQSNRLRILGFKRSDIVVWNAAKLGIPSLLAFCVLAIALMVFLFHDVRIPVSCFVISASDIRRSVGLIVLSCLGVWLLFSLVWILFSMTGIDRSPNLLHSGLSVTNVSASNSLISRVFRRRSRAGAGAATSGTTARTLTMNYSEGKASIALLAIPGLTIVTYVLNQQGGVLALILFACSVVILVLTLGDLVRMIISECADVLKRVGIAHNSPETMIGGANVRFYGGSLAGMSITLAAAIIAFSLINSLFYSWNQVDPQDKAQFDTFNGRLVEIDVEPTWDKSTIDTVSRSLEGVDSIADAAIVSSFEDISTGAVTLHVAVSRSLASPGTMEGVKGTSPLNSYLTRVGVQADDIVYSGRSPQQELAALVPHLGSVSADASTPSRVQNIELVLAAGEDATIDRSVIEQVLLAHHYPSPHISSPAESWVASGRASQNLVAWMRVFSALGIFFVLLSVGIMVMDERYDAADRLAPLSGLMGRRIHIGWMTAIRAVLPCLIGIGVGLLVAVPLNFTLLKVYNTSVEPVGTLLMLVSVVGAAVTLAIWLTLTIVTKRRVAQWKK
ncbi:MAG: hypothetical protein SPI12_02115 [Actinomycetaceae bacterium]|nr:hypothetical protein [Actinomycetaceae bacterium]MDY6082643.1 hypothetical protein [Actinomycetaceae bacterium]